MSSQDVNNEPTGAVDACEACPLGGIVERRAFLRDATLAVAGIFVALGAATSDARALPVRMAVRNYNPCMSAAWTEAS